MAFNGMLVDVEYCTGCEACVLACQQEHGFSEKEFGIKVVKLGPFKIAEKQYQYDFIPQFTDWCDLCATRRAGGKQPTCAQHCQSRSLQAGDVEELSKKVFRRKQIVVALQEK